MSFSHKASICIACIIFIFDVFGYLEIWKQIAIFISDDRNRTNHRHI